MKTGGHVPNHWPTSARVSVCAYVVAMHAPVTMCVLEKGAGGYFPKQHVS